MRIVIEVRDRYIEQAQGEDPPDKDKGAPLENQEATLKAPTSAAWERPSPYASYRPVSDDAAKTVKAEPAPHVPTEERLAKGRGALASMIVTSEQAGRPLRKGEVRAAKKLVGPYLDLILESFPNRDHGVAADRLLWTAIYAGSAAREVFAKGLGEVVRESFGRASYRATLALLELCKQCGERSPECIEAAKTLYGAFDRRTKAGVLLEVATLGFQRAKHSKSEFVGFFGSVMRSMDPDFAGKNWKGFVLFFAEPWNQWDPKVAPRLAKDFESLVPYLRPATVAELRTIVDGFDGLPTEAASVLIREGKKVAELGGAPAAARFFHRIKEWSGKLGIAYAADLAEYFSALEPRGRGAFGAALLQEAYTKFERYPFAHEKIAKHLGFFREVLSRASNRDIETAQEALWSLELRVRQLSHRPRENDPPGMPVLTQIASCLLYASDKGLCYVDGPHVIADRIKEFVAGKYYRAPVLEIPPNLMVKIPIARYSDSRTVEGNRGLDDCSIYWLQRKFLPEFAHWEDSFEALTHCVNQLERLLGRTSSRKDRDYYELIPLFAEVARRGSDAAFNEACDRVMPHLVRAMGMHIPRLAVDRTSPRPRVLDYNSPTAVYNFLIDLHNLLDSRIVPYLWDGKVSSERIATFKAKSKVHVIADQIEKFKLNLEGHDICTARLGCGMDGYARAWFDQSAESCLLKTVKGNFIDRSPVPVDYHPWWNDDTKDHMGRWDVMKIDDEGTGEPAILLTGDGVKASYGRLMHGRDLRYAVTKAYLEVGKYNNQAPGGVCQGIGAPDLDAGKPFTQLDRILNYAPLISQFIPRKPIIRELRNPLSWPHPDYPNGGTITHVIWLAGGPLGKGVIAE